MEIRENTDSGSRIVEVWLARAESQDPAICAQLKPFCQKYKAKGCTVVVFCSGTQDLTAATSDLLCYNRKRLA